MFFATPPKVVFYEKTGCQGNKRQKELLSTYGVEFEVRSLLDTKWDKATLETFFKGLSVTQIINPFAPQLKDKTFKPQNYTKEEMIEKMLKEPLLIKRPLIEVGEEKLCGFDIEKLNKLLHVKMPVPPNINACLSSDKCE